MIDFMTLNEMQEYDLSQEQVEFVMSKFFDHMATRQAEEDKKNIEFVNSIRPFGGFKPFVGCHI